MENIFCLICGKFKKINMSYISEKTLVLWIICNKCSSEDEKIFKVEESTEVLKILSLITNIEGY